MIGDFGGYEPVRGGGNSSTGNGGPTRLNNSVKFETANYSGFTAGALWGAGEVAANTFGNRTSDIYGRYKGYGFDAMVSVVNDKADLIGQNIRTVWTTQSDTHTSMRCAQAAPGSGQKKRRVHLNPDVGRKICAHSSPFHLRGRASTAFLIAKLVD